MGALGVSLGPLGASFGVPRVVLGVIFGPLGFFWVSFGVSGRFQGTSGAYFKDLFDRLLSLEMYRNVYQRKGFENHKKMHD